MGTLIPPGSFGVDFALPAMFICLIVLQVRHRTDVVVVLLAGGLTVGLTVASPGNQYIAIIAGMMVVTYVPRAAPLLILPHVDLPKPVRRWLEFVPAAIMSALVAPGILAPGGHLAQPHAPGGDPHPAGRPAHAESRRLRDRRHGELLVAHGVLRRVRCSRRGDTASIPSRCRHRSFR